MTGPERVNGETMEWGGAPAEKASWLDAGSPIQRGAGFGLAVAGFVLLVVAQVIPWMSYTTNFLNQDFPTASGGTTTLGAADLPFSTEYLNLGWLALLAAVATGLVIGRRHRRIVMAAGLGLAAGQVALLAGLVYGIMHPNPLYQPAFGGGGRLPTHVELGVFAAFAAVVCLAGALLLAGGFNHHQVPDEPADPEDDNAGPADLTVTPVPVEDVSVWSDRTDRRP
jgi:hypothetical protein